MGRYSMNWATLSEMHRSEPASDCCSNIETRRFWVDLLPDGSLLFRITFAHAWKERLDKKCLWWQSGGLVLVLLIKWAKIYLSGNLDCLVLNVCLSVTFEPVYPICMKFCRSTDNLIKILASKWAKSTKYNVWPSCLWLPSMSNIKDSRISMPWDPKGFLPRIRGDPFFRMVMAYPHVNYQNSELLFTLLLHNKTRPLTAQQMISKLIMFMKLLILKHSRLSIDFCFFSTITHGYDKCDHLFASKLPWISISKQIGHLQSEQF